MMNNVTVKFFQKDGSVFSFSRCVNFLFKKEFYTPFSVCSGTFILPENSSFNGENSVRTEFFLDGKILHSGLTEKVKVNREKGNLLVFSSRSHTLLLGQNEPEPKINSDVNLENLISDNISCPYIEWERDTAKVNYIYVNEHSTIWDALNNYCLKAYGTRPYIRESNKVYARPCSFQADFSGRILTRTFFEKNDELILSDIFMADLNGEYTFHKSCDKAKEVGIERKKYISLDRQWLSDSETGLSGMLDFSLRKNLVKGFAYNGFSGEDICDTVTNSGTVCDGMKINAVTVKGDKSGIFTTISCYDDPYGQK